MGLTYRSYRNQFKSKIIPKVLEFIDLKHNFSYSQLPAGHTKQIFFLKRMLFEIIESLFKFISFENDINTFDQSTRHSFVTSRLFHHAPNRLFEEDCITGTWGYTTIYFSEIKAARKVRKSKGKTEYKTIFNGLFFRANFNKSFESHTVVVPDVAERMLGSVIGNMMQSHNKAHGNELIKLEDPEFERLFAVYGNDQIEARYILSTSLMERLVNFRKRIKKNLRVSFIDNNIYIAIHYRKNLFEPTIFRNLMNPKAALEYFQALQMMLSIVDELNLNRRIWK